MILETLFDAFDKAEKMNEKNLEKILLDNQDTDYGRTYGFASIRSWQEYCRQVPLTEYADYEDYIEKKKGLVVYPVKYTLLTSGTMGKQKKLLLTGEALKRYSAYIYEMPVRLCGCMNGKHLHTSVFRSPGSAGTILSCAYYEYLKLSKALNTDDFFGGKDFLFSDEINSVPYVKLWLALSCPDLSSIQSIFIYDMLLFFRYLEEHYEMLLSDLENRQVSISLTESVKEKLLKIPPVEKERMEELKGIFAEGFHAPIVPRIWKNLKFVSGIDSNHYIDQTEKLKRYIGEVPVFYFAYASSEVMAGVATEFGKKEYTLLPDSAFYEFLPLDSESETVLPCNLSVGTEYEPVVTTFSGLYRYRTGDIVKITGFYGESPVFEVRGRRKNLINLAGEKIDFPTLGEAVKHLEEELGVSIEEFSIGCDQNEFPGRYTCFMETGQKELDLQKAGMVFDEALKKLSADYEDVRQLGMLNVPRMVLLPAFSHREYKEIHHTLSHDKPKAVLSKEQFNHFMARSVEKSFE